MNITYKNITIREARPSDAAQLCLWWNDGEIMAHAGFPKGLGVKPEVIAREIKTQDEKNLRHVIEYEGTLIGEMNYRRVNEEACEIGIKICDSSRQNRGLGKIILSLFISELFNRLGFKKIVLDTDLANLRAQRVYEQLGFEKLRVNQNSWRDQLGRARSSVDYELTEERFISYIKAE